MTNLNTVHTSMTCTWPPNVPLVYLNLFKRIRKIHFGTFYMVEHYLDIKRKHNFNSKDTMLQIVTTPPHNCQKFVSKRVETDAVFMNEKTQTFYKNVIFEKLPLSLTILFAIFLSIFHLVRFWLFFSFLWFASDVLLILSNLKI